MITGFSTMWAAIPFLPRRGLVGLVKLYRLFFKAWLGSACRFEPSCSAYALQALGQHGAARGAWLTAGRLLRCHPYCAGGCDPVPQDFTHPATGLFTRLGLRQAGAPQDNPSIRNLP